MEGKEKEIFRSGQCQEPSAQGLGHHRSLAVTQNRVLQHGWNNSAGNGRGPQSLKRYNPEEDKMAVVHVDVDSPWKLRNAKKAIEVPFEVPGYILGALQSAGVIGDPLYRMNEVEYKWVAEEEWEIRTEFTFPSNIEDKICKELVISGIDTVASIFVNDVLVGETCNAHREHRWPLNAIIGTAQGMIIRIIFASAVKVAEAKAKEYPYPLPAVEQGTFKHYNFLRKAACDFGWDWGPGFAQCGIFGHMKTIKLTGTDDEGQFEFVTDPISLDAKLYKLWWPHDMGDPHLYTINATLRPAGNQNAQSGLSRKIGLRKVELIREPLSPEGESFYFKINDVPVFAKGANMIPMDIIHSKPSKKEIETIVRDAKAANMNMLRIWGGGNYGDEEIFRVCDEEGIMIWQEAMFACAMYPRDHAFLKEVRFEIEYQMYRLGSHPCIVIWGGNNEVEDSFSWFKETRDNPSLYAVDMCELSLNVIKKTIEKVDPRVIFVDTSPSNGIWCVDPYVKRFGHTWDPKYGDVHFYNYKDDCLDYSIYPKAKFISEFGFQSFPSFSAYAAVSKPEDWSYGSELSLFRQRHPNGNQELIAQLEKHFVVPPETDLEGDIAVQTNLFKRWIYLTQLLQALCYDTAVRYWRSLKDDPVALTRGVLYWQLNDIWQGPSWSGINYGGKWKLLHYMAAKFYAPLLVSAYVDKNGDFCVYLVNDMRHNLIVHTEITAIPFSSDKIVRQFNLIGIETPMAEVAANSTLLALQTPLERILREQGLSRREFLIHVMVHANISKPSDDPTTKKPDEALEAPPSPNPKALQSDAVVMLSSWKTALIQDPKIHASNFEQVDSKTIKFFLTTANVIPHVAVDIHTPGRFSDNVILLLPWSVKEVSFVADEDINVADFKDALEIYAPVDASANEWVLLDADFDSVKQ